MHVTRRSHDVHRAILLPAARSLRTALCSFLPSPPRFPPASPKDEVLHFQAAAHRTEPPKRRVHHKHFHTPTAAANRMCRVPPEQPGADSAIQRAYSAVLHATAQVQLM